LPKEVETTIKHAEPEKEGESFVGKITGLFRRGTEHPDYPPISETYAGPLASTSRASEVDGMPLGEHVHVYHSGRSDEIVAPIKEEAAPKEPTKDAFERLAGLFKKGTAHEDYPVSDVYEGPLATTSRSYDVDGHPLETHVSVYHSGRSDEVNLYAVATKHNKPQFCHFLSFYNFFLKKLLKNHSCKNGKNGKITVFECFWSHQFFKIVEEKTIQFFV
jgi:hypothetical protein